MSLSFMIYYTAKLLLGLAAVVFGLSFLAKGGKAIGGLTAIAGTVAMLANTILFIFLFCSLGLRKMKPSAKLCVYL